MRMGSRHRMLIATADVQVPVRRRFMTVPVRVTVDASGTDTPERDRAEHNQQDAAEHLAAALDDERERPPEQDDRTGAECEQERMTDREPDSHAERACALDDRRLRAAAARHGRDRRQGIGAETVKEPENESCREQNQNVTAAVSWRRPRERSEVRPSS